MASDSAIFIHFPHISQIWVCLKIVYPIVPNGYWSLSLWKMAKFHWEYNLYTMTDQQLEYKTLRFAYVT